MPEHAGELPDGVDIGKYVGGAIVVFNLNTKQVKWTQDLDLSTDSVSFRAYIYSSPTVVDVDEDGYLEILVGTSFGFLYVLHHNGTYFHLLNDNCMVCITFLLIVDTHIQGSAFALLSNECS